jgi:hypothetical protein
MSISSGPGPSSFQHDHERKHDVSPSVSVYFVCVFVCFSVRVGCTFFHLTFCISFKPCPPTFFCMCPCTLCSFTVSLSVYFTHVHILRPCPYPCASLVSVYLVCVCVFNCGLLPYSILCLGACTPSTYLILLDSRPLSIRVGLWRKHPVSGCPCFLIRPSAFVISGKAKLSSCILRYIFLDKSILMAFFTSCGILFRA